MSKAETRANFRTRLEKRWRSKLARECLTGERSFPLDIAIQKPSLDSSSILSNITQLRDWLEGWETGATGIGAQVRIDTVKKSGYTLKIPHSVQFSSSEAVARYISSKTAAEWRRAEARLGALHNIDPRLCDLSSSWVSISALSEPDWKGFCGLLSWRRANPRVNCFLREIPVPHLHTKWVETNTSLVLRALSSLDLIDTDASGFNLKAGFRDDDTRTLWMRLPADGMLPAGAEVALRPSMLNAAPFGTERVLIVENLTTFRTIEPSAGTLVMFGSGNEFVSSIKDLDWLCSFDTYYWGDADIGGYEILNRLRARQATLKSVMMDPETIAQNSNMIVDGPLDRKIDQQFLTPDEQIALQRVLEAGGRLEQERLKGNLDALARNGLIDLPRKSEFAIAS